MFALFSTVAAFPLLFLLRVACVATLLFFVSRRTLAGSTAVAIAAVAECVHTLASLLVAMAAGSSLSGGSVSELLKSEVFGPVLWCWLAILALGSVVTQQVSRTRVMIMLVASTIARLTGTLIAKQLLMS